MHKKNKLTSAILGILSTLAGTHALAQDDNVLEEEVIVTGIRGSLLRAQAVKMNNSSVVESISAEDIGKLPDSSIAESLARLPGLAGERRNGRTSGIAVRGFREDYVGTTLNGRELIGTGDNRGVEYDLYPSEIISGAVIHKTASATLGTTGVGGTVDLQTTRPLDAEPTFTINGTLEQDGLDASNPEYDEQGHRLAASFSGRFLDDKLGLALTLATVESPNHERFQRNRGFRDSFFESGPNAGAFASRGSLYAANTRVLERDTVAAVVQFEPTDNITATLDYLYIDFSDSGVTRGINESFGYASDGSGIISASGGVVTAATTSPSNFPVIRTDPLNKTGELDIIGFNLEWQINDIWGMDFDLSSSSSDKQEQQSESYAGNGRAGHPDRGAEMVRSYTLNGDGVLQFNSSNGGNNIDLGDYDVVSLAGTQSWGGGLAAVSEFTDATYPGVSFGQAQDGFDNEKVFEESLRSFRAELSGDLDLAFIKKVTVGVSVTDHEKSKDNLGFFLTSNLFPEYGAIPEEYRFGVTDLSWAGLGNLVAYDAQALIHDSDYYIKTSAQDLEANRQADTYTVTEDYWTQYAQLDFETGDAVRIFGNIGYQAISSKHTVDNINSTTGADFRATREENTTDSEYFNFLPSVNVNFDFNNGHMLRAALGKVISRPRIDDLGQGSFVRFDFDESKVSSTDPESGLWTSSSGNPDITPYEVQQFDVSYEWYFSDLGYLSAGYFHKDLTNWHRSATIVRDYSDVYIPGFHQTTDSNGDIITPATFLGIDTVVEDGLTGSVDGFEFVASIPFGHFVEQLEGLGLVYSASFTQGSLNADTEDDSKIPGLSDIVRQITTYYEIGGFEARLAYTFRSDFQTEQGAVSNSLQAADANATELLDAQISYDFADSNIPGLAGLSVSLQGQNLTNEKDVFSDGDGRVVRVREFGPRYLFNVSYDIW